MKDHAVHETWTPTNAQGLPRLSVMFTNLAKSIQCLHLRVKLLSKITAHILPQIQDLSSQDRLLEQLLLPPTVRLMHLNSFS